MCERWSPNALRARSEGPLKLAAHGGFYVGADPIVHDGKVYAAGQAYVEYFLPEKVAQPFPLVMIHGGGSHGLDFITTPDGREGWALYFVRRGFCVYVLDRTGSGRAAQHPAISNMMSALPTPYGAIMERFSTCAKHAKWPAASLHNQWPGDGSMQDDSVAQFAARLGPSIGSLEASHRYATRVGLELLKAIGPALLLTHSLGGPWGWMFADSMPTHVKGILSVEPFGPPFAVHATGRLNWGVAAAPLAYEPEVTNVQHLVKEWEILSKTSGEDIGCKKRKLTHISGIPIAVVTAEASWQAHDGHLIVDFLRAAGCTVDHLRLAAVAIKGNGHAPMLERNNKEVAYELHQWLVGQGLARRLAI